MSTVELVVIICAAVLILLVIGNLIFSRLAERKNPPIGSFIECDGVRLHYLDYGEATNPCVVLLHGNGSMMQDFIINGLVDLLVRDHRVLCFDRPGFGYSQRPRSRIWSATAQADLLVKALNQLDVRDPVVLGHSWGTLVAIALASRDGYPIRGLVLASGYYFPTWRWDVWMMSGPAVPVLGDVLRYTVAPIISWAMLPGLFRKLFAPRPVPPSFKNRFPASLTLRPKQLRSAAEESAFLLPTAAQFQFRYSNLRCPVHIFHGTGDQVIELEQSKRLSQAVHRSDLRLVQDAGHMVTYADGTAMAKAVERMTPAIRSELERRHTSD
jgi:pimeloyl-ACP methyl ester carboxylesterase